MDSAGSAWRVWVVASAAALWSGQALAATIYGSLTANGQPLASAEVVLKCGARELSYKTDAQGAFRFTLDTTGTCELRVAGVTAHVIVSKEPTRYDYEVRRSGGGTTLVRR